MTEVFEATGNEIPSNSVEITMPRLLLGAGRHFNLSDKFTSAVEAGLDVTFDGKRNTLIKTSAVSMDPRLGVEFGFKDFAFLRAGVGNFQQETQFGGNKTMTLQPNFGVGFVIKKMVTIDYAFTDIGNASIALYSNIFSVRVDLGKK
jgi:hypothetical protein